ncbi:MAG: hypothetical protein ACREOL_02820 [Candidatus Dormibacteria bacterium]
MLRSNPGRGLSRVLLLGGAAFLAVILFRVVGGSSAPPPSHHSPQAAAQGYLDGLSRRDAAEIRSYLAPAERAQATGLLRILSSDHVSLSGPAAAPTHVTGSTVTVPIAIEVCLPLPDHQGSDCRPVQNSPVGLPAQLKCVRRAGRWYVATLFKPS